jgi:hypothetical protein
MSWADTMKATALAALAERTAPTARIVVDAPWTWNAKDVWLARARQPAAASTHSSVRQSIDALIRY